MIVSLNSDNNYVSEKIINEKTNFKTLRKVIAVRSAERTSFLVCERPKNGNKDAYSYDLLFRTTDPVLALKVLNKEVSDDVWKDTL